MSNGISTKLGALLAGGALIVGGILFAGPASAAAGDGEAVNPAIVTVNLGAMEADAKDGNVGLLATDAQGGAIGFNAADLQSENVGFMAEDAATNIGIGESDR